ncbi:MAG: VWA domain-containing protein [Deltaproteobacteria bacterium]|nr:VWA domain-containing protein [Deltaproteobacteria bacterium]
MLLTFLYTLRALKIPVGTQEWLALMEALIKNQGDSSLTHFYQVARSILVKSEALYDSFDQAFLICFKGYQGNFDIKKELLDWLNKSLDPSQRPPLPQIPPLALEELRKKFLERLKEQMEEHHGGSHWIGTGGTSPFGHSGSHPSGIRIGGPGGGRSAVQVAEERRFANYRQDRILDTRQFKVALKRLRKLDFHGEATELNIDKSIDKTCKNVGEIELVFQPPRKNQTELLLLMDVGGSMDPYAELMEALFSAAHASTHFKAFRHFYFHNCIYSRLYNDMFRREFISTEELFKTYRKSFHVVIVGDACMNPYELLAQGGAIEYWEMNQRTGLEWFRLIKQHYPSTVWLNPEPEDYWGHHTIEAIKRVFKMYPLTVSGLTEAVDDLRGERVNTA